MRKLFWTFVVRICDGNRFMWQGSNYERTRIPYANSKDPDQNAQIRGLESDKILQVCSLYLAYISVHACMYTWKQANTCIKRKQSSIHSCIPYIKTYMHAHACIYAYMCNFMPACLRHRQLHKCMRAYIYGRVCVRVYACMVHMHACVLIVIVIIIIITVIALYIRTPLLIVISVLNMSK